jgi:protein phosphatase
MSARFTHAAATDTGKVRSENEDAWSADDEAGIYVVSDGMGGRASGAIASKVVTQALPRVLSSRAYILDDLARPEAAQALAAAICDLSQRVRERTEGQPGLDGMGATLVVAVTRPGAALVAHLGDSRAYHFRDGTLALVTTDHSVAQLLVDGGDLSQHEARNHPTRAQLTRYVGMDAVARADAIRVEMVPGDRLLLCTDGLTGMVSDDEIAEILSRGEDLETTCVRLVSEANRAGGKDNATVMLIEASD